MGRDRRLMGACQTKLIKNEKGVYLSAIMYATNANINALKPVEASVYAAFAPSFLGITVPFLLLLQRPQHARASP